MGNISKLELVSELNSISKQSTLNGICLFLGAGADISSGGVLFSDLKRESVSLVRNTKIHEYESSDLIDKEFDNIINSLDEASRCMVIEYLIKNSEQWLPSDGYKLLILLAKENCISSVITTNFANLLETTQSQMGIDAFQIFTPATAIPAQYFINSKSKKAIYLKMHGDIDGRLITHLTSLEIQYKSYQTEFISLFEHLIRNETLVFLGYSGWDTKIAEIFEHNISTIKKVYWCNIHEPDENAPLIKLFRKHNINIRFLNYNFDNALQIIATEFFKDRTLFHVDSIFIWALIKAKIQKLQTEFFKNIETESKRLLPISRTKIDILHDFILEPYRNFCFITGNSGSGKSILMSEYCKTYNLNDQIWVIPLNAMTTYSNNLLDYIVKKLGYASKDAYTVLYQFSRWAYEQNKYFVFVIDNLGNRIGTIKEIATLINKLIELAYVIRNHQHMKFVITLRTNIWNNVYPLLDSNYLNTIIWNDYEENSTYAVRLGSFDKFELDRAESAILSLTNTLYIPDDIRELIKEPSLYGLIQQNINILENINELDIYKIFEKTFFNGISKIVLEKLAYSLLCKHVKSYKPLNFTQETNNYLLNTDILRNILSIEEDKIEFKNDLVFECCLASYFNSTNYINIFIQYYKCFEQDYLSCHLPSPVYHGIIRYLGVVCGDFGNIIKLLYLLLSNCTVPSNFLAKFVNDVFKYMAQYNFKSYSNNICNFDTNCKEFSLLLPFIMHSVGFMKDQNAFPLLAFLCSKNPSSCKLECYALINDRFTMGIRKSASSQNTTKYFQTYIKYIIKNEKPLISLFLLLWIMGRIGRENVSFEIYQTIAKLVAHNIKNLNYKPNTDEINEVKNLFLKNCYFIFFNSNSNLEEKYHFYPQKSVMIPIIKQTKHRTNLNPKQLSTICSLVDHFDETIEFFVCNMLFVYMAVHDLTYALNNLDALYNCFDENTSVLELDFYSSALFLSCYIVDPLNRQSYVERYNNLVNDFEVKMFISPSMDRLSSCRKFEDKFEVEFEDGFNNFTAYTHTAPMDNYTGKSNKKSIDTYLSILWDMLAMLDQNGMYDEMLRLVQAINQMSVNWPEEALEALRKFSKYNHPIVRKAIIRTLKENYLRYPNIVTSFLNQTGEAFSEDELLEIYSATNSQIESRTLEQLQWARIIYFIKEYINPYIMDDLFEIIISCNTLYEVFDKIINIFFK